MQQSTNSDDNSQVSEDDLKSNIMSHIEDLDLSEMSDLLQDKHNQVVLIELLKKRNGFDQAILAKCISTESPRWALEMVDLLFKEINILDENFLQELFAKITDNTLDNILQNTQQTEFFVNILIKTHILKPQIIADFLNRNDCEALKKIVLNDSKYILSLLKCISLDTNLDNIAAIPDFKNKFFAEISADIIRKQFIYDIDNLLDNLNRFDSQGNDSLIFYKNYGVKLLQNMQCAHIGLIQRIFEQCAQQLGGNGLSSLHEYMQKKLLYYRNELCDQMLEYFATNHKNLYMEYLTRASSF